MKTTNTIKKAVIDYETRIGSPFKPTKEMFYRKVGINQKRYGQLLRGEKDPMITELKNLSNFFQIPINELI